MWLELPSFQCGHAVSTPPFLSFCSPTTSSVYTLTTLTNLFSMPTEKEKVDLEAGEAAARPSSSELSNDSHHHSSSTSGASTSAHGRGEWKKDEVHEIPNKSVYMLDAVQGSLVDD